MWHLSRRLAVLVLPVALLISLTLTAGPVAAQTVGQAAQVDQAVPAQPAGNGLKISPARFDVSLQPGQSRSVSITVENVSSASSSIQAVVSDFTAGNDETGRPRLILDPATTPPLSFRKLVSPVPPFTLASHEKRSVTIDLVAPQTVVSGGYYGAVRFGAATTGDGSNIALSASTGSIFLVTVPGNLTERLTLDSFGINQDGRAATVFGDGKLTVVSRLKNTGNIHLQPYGKIAIKNYRGATLQQLELNNTQPRGSVLPDSVRKFQNPIGANLTYGVYHAEASFGYGTKGRLLLASKTFYVIPFKLLAGLIVVVAVVLYTVLRLHGYVKSRRTTHL